MKACWWLVSGVIAVSGGLGCEPVVGADWGEYLDEGAISAGSGGEGGSWDPGPCVGDLSYVPLSCQGANSGQDDCGPSGNEDCCASPCVEGGNFNRSNDPAYPALVSTFRLDRYEVTVGRFRAFVEAGMGTRRSPPADYAGGRPTLPGSGWDGDGWDGMLAATTSDLQARLQVYADIDTWSGGDERRPINEVNWFEAFAFCAWDGGFLPTEAEWNYAAAGGAEQRPYPWGTPEPDSTRAVYDLNNVLSSIADVGSKPAGEGRWGQRDLAGNLWEWTLDWYVDPYPMPCTDCAHLSTASYRVLRGGGFSLDASILLSGVRTGDDPSDRLGGWGFRCARTP